MITLVFKWEPHRSRGRAAEADLPAARPGVPAEPAELAEPPRRGRLHRQVRRGGRADLPLAAPRRLGPLRCHREREQR